MSDRDTPSYPPVTGSAAWLEPDAADRLRRGETASLCVNATRRKRNYTVRAVVRDGAVVAYRMSYRDGEQEVAYTLTLGSGAGRERVVTCNCLDAMYRPREGGGAGSGCRHANALRAALAAIGML